ncbi:MAG TPA: adenosylcobinamide-GDP ribazoletransferase [Solirubrobacteraceae bacterium]|jgi:adenosylcobinamide-GDP ribazoletransferase|nr:adenosylcobinamide-GDP ribazoletransferase [Solirubrobacteraceae bacterium]
MTAEAASALRFMTTLPVARAGPVAPASSGRVFYPAVGVLVGALAWGAFWLGSTVASAGVGAFLAVAALVLVTGALHLDGLSDCADGLFGGSTVERRLEIMRDSRAGAFGVVAVVLVLAGDLVALGELTREEALAALIAAGALGRVAILALVATLAYVRPTGLGQGLGGAGARRDLAVGALVAAAAIALDWRHGLLAAGLVALVTWGLGAFARRRVGGATGDVYGAAVELSQVVALGAYTVRL